jgi:hypothetical protein
MMVPSVSGRSTRRVVLLLLLGAAAAAYTVAAIFVLNARAGHQIALTGHSFVLSDLFPRWLGARAMLAGENPYGASFTSELHRLYYGYDMSRETEVALFRNICEFFYPPFALLPLLPLLPLPFEIARWVATVGLSLAVMGACGLWCRLTGARPSRAKLVAGAAFALTFFPSLDLILLQQLAGLVFVYLVGAYFFAFRGRFVTAGMLLALALIKPQAAVLPAASLVFWSLWRRERWPLLFAFVTTAAAEMVLAEALVPSWFGQFVEATRRYQEYNVIGFWLPGLLFGSNIAGAALAAVPFLALLSWMWIRCRGLSGAHPALVHAATLTLAGVVIVMPDISYYNKVFLLPALVVLATAPPAASRVARLGRTLAWIGVALPALVLATAGALFVLLPPAVLGESRTLLATSIDAVQAFYILLPVIILPSLLTLGDSPLTSGAIDGSQLPAGAAGDQRRRLFRSPGLAAWWTYAYPGRPR